MPGEGGGRQVETAEPEVVAEIMDTLQALPEDRRQEMTALLYQHAGPLPDPATFAAYGSIHPDAPREILAMAVRQQEHDTSYAMRMLESEIGYRRETLWAATGVLLAIVAAATALGISGHEVAAGVMGGTGGLVIAAGAILRGRDLFPTGKSAPSTPPAVPVPQSLKPRPSRPPQRALAASLKGRSAGQPLPPRSDSARSRPRRGGLCPPRGRPISPPRPAAPGGARRRRGRAPAAGG